MESDEFRLPAWAAQNYMQVRHQGCRPAGDVEEDIRTLSSPIRVAAFVADKPDDEAARRNSELFPIDLSAMKED